MLERDSRGLSGILFSINTARRHNAQLPAGKQMGRQHNIGDLLKSASTFISENDPNFQRDLNEFPKNADSTILVRERARGAKLEPAFRRQRGRIILESKDTLSLLAAGKANPRLLSKRNVAHAHKHTDTQPPPRQQNVRREATNRSEATVIDEQTSSVQDQIAPTQPVGRKKGLQTTQEALPSHRDISAAWET